MVPLLKGDKESPPWEGGDSGEVESPPVEPLAKGNNLRVKMPWPTQQPNRYPLSAVAVAACGVAFTAWMVAEEQDIERILQIPAVQHLNLYPEDVADILEKQEMVVATIESMNG